MDIGEILQSIGNSIVNFFTDIGEFFSGISSLFQTVSSFILSIFGFIWYAGKTLIVGIGKLLYYITGIGLFDNVSQTIDNLVEYIGGPGIIFISALLLIIIIRIIVSFVFRLMRLNIDYHSLGSLTSFRNKHK